MRIRRLFIVGSAVAALGLIAAAVLGIVLYGMAGGSGENQQDVLASLVSRTLSTPATQVHVGAVDGVLSSDATVRDVSITDKDGVWLTLDKARLVWRRSALLLGRLEIDRLEIGTLEIKRKPLPSDQPAAESDQPILPDLPVKVQVRAFDLRALTLGQSILGEALSVAATGNTELGSPSEGLVFNLDATRKDFPGHFTLSPTFRREMRLPSTSRSTSRPTDSCRSSAICRASRPSHSHWAARARSTAFVVP